MHRNYSDRSRHASFQRLLAKGNQNKLMKILEIINNQNVRTKLENCVGCMTSVKIDTHFQNEDMSITKSNVRI